MSNFNKILSLIFFTSASILLYSCKSTKISKSETQANSMVILDSLHAQSNYFIDINVAYPFTTAATTRVANSLFRFTGDNANRIDVRGDGNFIEIKDNTIKGYLSFFGESRTNAGAYGGNDATIQFEEPLQELTKQLNEKKARLDLEFTTNQKGNSSESYSIKLEIYPNKHVNVHVTPVYKTFIRYEGTLKTFDTKK